MPGPRRGISPWNLSSEGADPLDRQFGVVPFRVDVTTDTTASSFQAFPSGCPYTCRVIGFEGIMQGAGAGGMTVQLKNNAGTAITDSISVAVLPTKAKFDCAAIDTAQWTVNKGDKLTIATASSPLTRCSIILVRTDS